MDFTPKKDLPSENESGNVAVAAILAAIGVLCVASAVSRPETRRGWPRRAGSFRDCWVHLGTHWGSFEDLLGLFRLYGEGSPWFVSAGYGQFLGLLIWGRFGFYVGWPINFSRGVYRYHNCTVVEDWFEVSFPARTSKGSWSKWRLLIKSLARFDVSGAVDLITAFYAWWHTLQYQRHVCACACVCVWEWMRVRVPVALCLVTVYIQYETATMKWFLKAVQICRLHLLSFFYENPAHQAFFCLLGISVDEFIGSVIDWKQTGRQIEREDILTNNIMICYHYVFIIISIFHEWVNTQIDTFSDTKSNLTSPLIFQMAYMIYRYFRKRSVHSMNFDNPVYKKTTTEDGFHLAGQQRTNCPRNSGQPRYQHQQYGVASPEDVSFSMNEYIPPMLLPFFILYLNSNFPQGFYIWLGKETIDSGIPW